MSFPVSQVATGPLWRLQTKECACIAIGTTLFILGMSVFLYIAISANSYAPSLQNIISYSALGTSIAGITLFIIGMVSDHLARSAELKERIDNINPKGNDGVASKDKSIHKELNESSEDPPAEEILIEDKKEGKRAEEEINIELPDTTIENTIENMADIKVNIKDIGTEHIKQEKKNDEGDGHLNDNPIPKIIILQKNPPSVDEVTAEVDEVTAEPNVGKKFVDPCDNPFESPPDNSQPTSSTKPASHIPSIEIERLPKKGDSEEEAVNDSKEVPGTPPPLSPHNLNPIAPTLSLQETVVSEQNPLLSYKEYMGEVSKHLPKLIQGLSQFLIHFTKGYYVKTVPKNIDKNITSAIEHLLPVLQGILENPREALRLTLTLIVEIGLDYNKIDKIFENSFEISALMESLHENLIELDAPFNSVNPLIKEFMKDLVSLNGATAASSQSIKKAIEEAREAIKEARSLYTNPDVSNREKFFEKHVKYKQQHKEYRKAVTKLVDCLYVQAQPTDFYITKWAKLIPTFLEICKTSEGISALLKKLKSKIDSSEEAPVLGLITQGVIAVLKEGADWEYDFLVSTIVSGIKEVLKPLWTPYLEPERQKNILNSISGFIKGKLVKVCLDTLLTKDHPYKNKLISLFESFIKENQKGGESVEAQNNLLPTPKDQSWEAWMTTYGEWITSLEARLKAG